MYSQQKQREYSPSFYNSSEDMTDSDEIQAAQGLLGLTEQKELSLPIILSSHQYQLPPLLNTSSFSFSTTLSTSSSISSSSSFSGQEKRPINVFQPPNNSPLPSFSYILSSAGSDMVENGNSQHHHRHHCTRPYHLSPPVKSVYSHSTPTLSHRASLSSLLSNAPSLKEELYVTKTTRRRGRPRKNIFTKPVSTGTNHAHVDGHHHGYFDPIYSSEGQSLSNFSSSSSPMATTSPSATNKPRWKPDEKYLLLQAVIKEKSLDDMASMRWDKISLMVGRATKACKDQWRRELLPSIMNSFKSTSMFKANKKGSITTSDSGGNM